MVASRAPAGVGARDADRAASCGRSTSSLVVMAQLFVLLCAIVLLVAITFYARFVFRRFGLITGSPPQFIGPRLRGIRLILFWLAIAFTAVVVVPTVIVAIGQVLGMNDCRAHFSPGDPWGCSPNVRLFFAVAVVVVGLPLGTMWIRFLLTTLARVKLSYDD